MNGLQQLLETLDRDDVSNFLDEKLAEYVFFPLSHVLRQLEKLPLRAQELTLKCILVLLKTGWSQNPNPELCIQLIILLSFLTDWKDGKASMGNTEDLMVIGQSCMASVFEAMSRSPKAQEALLSLPNVPHIGKAVSVILDLIAQPDLDPVRMAALLSLQSFCQAWPDLDVMSTNFFPGIISCLTKLLTPKSSTKTGSKSLVLATNILTHLITTVLADERTKTLPKQEGSVERPAAPTKSWLKATVSQLKVAMASILKLRRHDRPSVRSSVANLCIKCVDECWETLADCREMFLETLIVISADEPETALQLKRLMVSHDAISGILKTNLYNGIVALPRISLSPDELVRERSLNQIALTLQILSEQGEQILIAKDLLASNIRDAVVNAIQNTPNLKIGTENEAIATDTSLISLHSHGSTVFDDTFSSSKGQSVIFRDISQFLNGLSSQSTLVSIARYLSSSLQGGSENDQLGNLWILNLILKRLHNDFDWASALTNDSFDTEINDISDQVYGYALTVLSEQYNSARDWRLQGLALEAIALQAQLLKEDFREELLDSLYPVVQSLASVNAFVQRQAMTCLNVMSIECGYRDSGALLVENVDYLVNSVGLRLNTFELSPQAPQVLIMMIKLAGPSLLLFIDDLVENIFAALESFHGYPKLVDLLFAALSSVVEEGIKSPHLTITDGDKLPRKRFQVQPMRLNDLLSSLRTKRKDEENRENHPLIDKDSGTNFPKKPWKSSSESGKENLDEEEADDNTSEPTEEKDKEEQALSKPHTLLLNISKLTQHYLTTSSLSLRIRLLTLLKTSIPALGGDENSFLPLIHTLWPVVSSRIDDDEAYVVAGALDVIALMCEHSGNFMTKRINETWKAFQRVHARCLMNVPRAQPKPALDLSKDNPLPLINKTGTVPGTAISTTAAQFSWYSSTIPSGTLWNSFINVMMAIAANVGIPENRFEELVDMLLPAIHTRQNVYGALEARNPDAVWLARWKRLKLDGPGNEVKHGRMDV
jgi:TELO2-interacting protein 1